MTWSSKRCTEVVLIRRCERRWIRNASNVSVMHAIKCVQRAVDGELRTTPSIQMGGRRTPTLCIKDRHDISYKTVIMLRQHYTRTRPRKDQRHARKTRSRSRMHQKNEYSNAMLERTMSNPCTSPHVLPRYAAEMKEERENPDLMIQRVSASLLFLAPPALEETPLARRTASLARGVTVGLVVSPPPVALPARRATSSADTALDRACSRSDSRTIVVGVRVGGAGARSEEGVRWRTGVTPWPRTRVVLVRARISCSSRASGVIADAVVHGSGARGPGAEEVDRAAG